MHSRGIKDDRHARRHRSRWHWLPLAGFAALSPVASAQEKPLTHAGIDTGRVSGPGTAYIPGNTTLAGGFFGLRGTYMQLSWDVFAGKAMHGGKVLENTRPATGFQVVYAF